LSFLLFFIVVKVGLAFDSYYVVSRVLVFSLL